MTRCLLSTLALPAAALLLAVGCQQGIPLPEPSTEGIVRHRDDFLGKDVQVRGVVKKLVKCPQPPPVEPLDVVEEGQESDAWAPPPRPPRTCDPPPHAYLVDKDAVSDRELLVYGSMWSPLADLELGQEVTLDGRFDIVSKDGVFLRQAGLVVLEDLPAPAPPAAPEADAGPTP